MTTAFPRDTQLTAIAIAYKNPDTTLIADAVLPRVPVGKQTFSYYEYPEADSYRVPDTRVGEKSQVGWSELAGTKETATTEDFGHEIRLTASDISEAPSGVDPKGLATEQATNVVLLDREIRVANLVFDAAQYSAANKLDVSAGAEWSDFVNGDPITDIIDGLDACLVRPNVLAFGQAVWSKVSRHPKVVAACLGNEGTQGVASRQRLAELLEVSEILVGASFFNTAKQGKAASLSRAWGKHALAFYRDRTVTTAGGMTFGISAQFGSRVAGSKEIDIGLRGGVAVRAGESMRELVIAPRAAFLFQNAVA